MIELGFNLLLFTVLLIIFIGYCWTIKIERDYKSKLELKSESGLGSEIEKFSTPNELSPVIWDTPLNIIYTKKNTCVNQIKVCDQNSDITSYDPGNIPSVSAMNMKKPMWRKNNIKIQSYPESDFISSYIPSSNTPDIYMGKNEALLSVTSTDIYDPTKSPINPKTNSIIAYNDDLLYTNTGTNPWQHHPVQTSIPVDTKVKFTHAYYFEFNNTDYLKNIKSALVVPCDLLADAVLTSNWTTQINPSDQSDQSDQTVQFEEATNAYYSCLQYIDRAINNSQSMILPSDTRLQVRSKIQIVHDIFKSYKIHTTSKSMFLIHMEIILYRQSKYHGKHIAVTCTAKKKQDMWIIHVVAIRILGVVSEENIGLFPVVPSDPLSVEQLPIPSDVSTIKSIVDSPAKKAYDRALIEAHDNEYNLIAATNKKLVNLINGIAKYNEV